MLHLVWTLALGLLLVSQYAFAQTGNEETICSSAAVILCENFEDRAVNSNIDLTRNIWSKNPSWGVSQPDCTGNSCTSVVTTPPGAPSFLGKHVMRFVTPANQTSGGFGGQDFPGGGRMDLYIRFYSMWCGPPVCSSTYIWSPIATKHFAVDNVSGPDSALWWFCGAACGTSASAEIQQFWYNTFNAPGEAGQNAGFNARAQNINGIQRINLNQWYCLELHMKMNSGTSVHDGIIEGWIDGVQHWNYQNQLIDMLPPTPNPMNSYGWFSYWNCSGPTGDPFDCTTDPAQHHPEIYRYGDNMIISTQRIGCLSDTRPNAPSVLLVH